MRNIRILILFKLLVSLLQINAQSIDEYVITLDLTKCINKADTVILNVGPLNIKDTLIGNNQKFLFQGKVSEPADAYIKINGIKYPFPIVNDEIIISFVKMDSISVYYKRSHINELISSYYEKADNFIIKYQALNYNNPGVSENDSRIKRVNQEDSLSLKFLNDLYDEYKKLQDKDGISLILQDLIIIIGAKKHPEKIQLIFDLMPDDIKKGYYGKNVQWYLDQNFKLKEGQKIDFSFIDINSNTHNINEYKGKYTLLVFWATWCGPCKAKIPMLKEIYLQYSSKIEIIHISIDKTFSEWISGSKELNLPWESIYYIQTGINLKEYFYVGSVPYCLVISKNGELLVKDIEIYQLEDYLKN